MGISNEEQLLAHAWRLDGAAEKTEKTNDRVHARRGKDGNER